MGASLSAVQDRLDEFETMRFLDAVDRVDRIRRVIRDVAPALLLLPSLSFAGGNTQNQSFSEAKKLLHTVVYADHRTTFYCGCRYDETKKIDISTCGYRPKGNSKRAERVEWDHVVPAESFGQSFKEWREGHPDCVDKKGNPFKGRKCAEKVNLPYRYMQAYPSLHVPLSMLRRYPCGEHRKTRGRCGSLLLHRVTLSFTTPRRFIPAH